MFCPKCGAQNDDTATFCSACGAPLPNRKSMPTPAPTTGVPAASPAPDGQKNALVAAILNLFWGLGYFYLGFKKVLGIPTIAFVVLMIIVYFVVAIFTIGLLTLIIAIVLAIDGYQKAKGKSGFVGAQR